MREDSIGLYNMAIIFGMSKKKALSFVEILLIILFAVGIITFYYWYISQMVNNWCYPAEYRDNAVFKLIEDLAKGDNPYSVDRLESSLPPVVLDSGFLHIYPAIFFVKVFGIKASGAMYLSNLIYLLLIAALTARTCISIDSAIGNNEKKLMLLEALCTIFCMLFYMQRATYLVTRPDIFCVILLLLIIDLFTKPVIKEAHIFIASFMCVLIAFAKIHYATILFSIILFLACRKEKKHRIRYIVEFCLSGIAFTIIVFLLVQWLYPTYLSFWIPRIMQMFMLNRRFTKDSVIYLINKIAILCKQLRLEIIVLLFGMVNWIVLKRGEWLKIDETSKFLIINSVINFFVLIYVGRHEGADFWYFYVMLVPSVILLSIKMIHRCVPNRFIYYSLIVLMLFGCTKKQIELMRHDSINNHKESFEVAYGILQKYESEEMFLSPYLSGYSMQKSIYNYNYGDSFYFVDESNADKMYNWIPCTKYLFPYTKDIFYQHLNYQKQIIEKVGNKEYSLIAIDNLDSIPPLFREEFVDNLNEHYQLEDTSNLNTLSGLPLRVEYWIPMAQ